MRATTHKTQSGMRDGVQSDFKVWKVGQCSTDTHIPLVSLLSHGSPKSRTDKGCACVCARVCVCVCVCVCV
jgi:hypothetical protein